MNCIEVFSGAGGLAKGLELAGIRHRAFVEWNSDACDTLRNNFDSRIVYETDVRNFQFSSFSNIDIIAGGPPCQPFSLGGKANGKDDVRDMFPAAIEAIKATTPKVFIFENVKGLLRNSFSDYFEYILLQLSYPQIKLKTDNWKTNLSSLRKLSLSNDEKPLYNVKYKLLNAADYGIPQTRERVIIVGFRNDIKNDWSFPQPTHSKDALLWDMFVENKYWDRHGIANYFPHSFVNECKRILIKKYGFFPPSLLPWQTVRDAIEGLGAPNDKDDHLLRKGAKEYPGHTGSYIDEPSKTIKAGDHGVPGGENMIKYPDGQVRYFTIAEAKRIQTFPDNYRIAGSWTEAMRQLGNAVPVKLATILAKSIFNEIATA